MSSFSPIFTTIQKRPGDYVVRLCQVIIINFCKSDYPIMISPHFDSDSIFVPFPRSINLPQGVPNFPLFMLTRTTRTSNLAENC